MPFTIYIYIVIVNTAKPPSYVRCTFRENAHREREGERERDFLLSLDREDVTFPNSTHLFFTPRKSKHPRCLRRFPRLHPSVEPKMACKQMPEDRSRSLSTFPSMGSRIPSSTRYLLNHETGIATVNHRPKSADKSMKFAFPVDRWMRKEWKDDRTRQGIFIEAHEKLVYINTSCF